MGIIIIFNSRPFNYIFARLPLIFDNYYPIHLSISDLVLIWCHSLGIALSPVDAVFYRPRSSFFAGKSNRQVLLDSTTSLLVTSSTYPYGIIEDFIPPTTIANLTDNTVFWRWGATRNASTMVLVLHPTDLLPLLLHRISKSFLTSHPYSARPICV